MIRFKASYAFTDEVRVTVGYDWNHGASDALFGFFKSNNGAYVELRRGF